MSEPEAERKKQRMRSNREELVERIARAIPKDGSLEVFPNFSLHRSSVPTEHVHWVSTPAFCIIAQARKEVLLGDELFRYDPEYYLIYTLDLPVVSRIEKASIQRPYLALRLNLDVSLVGSVMMESGIEIKKGDASAKAVDVRPTDADLLDAVVRLVRLIETREEQKILAPRVIGKSSTGFWWASKVRGLVMS